MVAAGAVCTVVEEMRKRVDDARKLVYDTRKLIDDARRVFERNLAVYEAAQATTRRIQKLLAQSRPKAHEPRWIARRLRLLIGSRIDEGRLPNCISPIVAGTPGFGGECEACNGYLPATRTVMSIPHGDTFVYLHADCYAIWDAQCRLRAALRRIA